MEIINSLPDVDKPSFFGLPANIERSSQRIISSQVCFKHSWKPFHAKGQISEWIFFSVFSSFLSIFLDFFLLSFFFVCTKACGKSNMVFRKEPSVTEKIQLPYQSSKNVESSRPAL